MRDACVTRLRSGAVRDACVTCVRSGAVHDICVREVQRCVIHLRDGGVALNLVHRKYKGK